eukprot:Blabericola_migrator_1__5887@NODE_297_length_10209_cov_136_062907_g244_i0_p6_GENE_NODE_297_length_10209_cov_136_062907_g244_i0NODE_297_length_10209_cov_136_062907_g244_i0_p6_ORF_typecomplete_len208_score17_31_NODE_297_length_10209_cov_136_062907_g244_i092189841
MTADGVIKDENPIPSTLIKRGSVGEAEVPSNDDVAQAHNFAAIERSASTCDVGRLWQWIERGGNGRMIVVALAPLVLLLLFPLLVALRLLVLLCLPISCLLPAYVVLKGVVMASLPRTLRYGLVITYIAVLGFAAIPYLFIWPFYGFLEVLPACIMTIPFILASLPLAICGGIAGGVVWFLSGSEYYSLHSYRMVNDPDSLYAAKKI